MYWNAHRLVYTHVMLCMKSRWLFWGGDCSWPAPKKEERNNGHAEKPKKDIEATLKLFGKGNFNDCKR